MNQEIYTVKIEQTYEYPHRMKYIAKTDSFIEKDGWSLSYARNVHQPYGWMVESGTPPHEHLDVIVMSNQHYQLGELVQVKIIGVYLRNDGDNKLVGVLKNREINDFDELSEEEKNDMRRLYPIDGPNEGWFGKEEAERVISEYFERRKWGIYS